MRCKLRQTNLIVLACERDIAIGLDYNDIIMSFAKKKARKVLLTSQ